MKEYAVEGVALLPEEILDHLDPRPAQDPMERVHQIPMTDKTEVTGFGKTNSDSHKNEKESKNFTV